MENECICNIFLIIYPRLFAGIIFLFVLYAYTHKTQYEQCSIGRHIGIRDQLEK